MAQVPHKNITVGRWGKQHLPQSNIFFIWQVSVVLDAFSVVWWIVIGSIFILLFCNLSKQEWREKSKAKADHCHLSSFTSVNNISSRWHYLANIILISFDLLVHALTEHCFMSHLIMWWGYGGGRGGGWYELPNSLPFTPQFHTFIHGSQILDRCFFCLKILCSVAKYSPVKVPTISGNPNSCPFFPFLP